jgi:hypothetical protein
LELPVAFQSNNSSFAAAILQHQPSGYWRCQEKPSTISKTLIIDEEDTADGERTSEVHIVSSCGTMAGAKTMAVATGRVTLGAPGALLHEPSTSVSFSGDGHLQVALDMAWNPHHQFSLSVWLRPTSGTKQSAVVSSFAANMNQISGYRLIINDDLSLVFQVGCLYCF